MCGIAGILRFAGSEEADRSLTARMLVPLERRGPDGSGLERDGLLTLGHCRLAILDLNERANQPMRSACGRYLLAFNGEVYNFRDLRDEMGLCPQDLRTTSDTEVILHAWSRWGPRALDRMVGQWSIAVYDSRERMLVLARDRFGEKPLFYHAAPAAITFASSIAALLEVPWVPRDLDPGALREYLTLRYVLAPRTVIRGVRKIRPGHLLAVRAGEFHERAWYENRFAASGTRRVGRHALLEEFGPLLAQASRRCSTSDVPIGILLSDGIDSNAIHASVRSFEPGIRTFTYEPVGRDESSVHPVRATERFRFGAKERLAAIEPAFSSLTEPIGDGAALATWMLIRAAREHAVVFLCGHGADEVLGGYRLSQARFRLAMIRRLAWLPDAAISKLLSRYASGTESAVEMKRRVRLSTAAALPGAARYVINRPVPWNDLAVLWSGGAPRADSRTPVADGSYLAGIDDLYARQPAGAGDLDRIQNVMIRTFLSENILTCADSVAMDASAELRMPFLDRDLVEFVFRLPASVRAGSWPGRTNTKRILRWWGRGRIDPEILRRGKQTFQGGKLRPMFEANPSAMRSYVLDARALRLSIPGLESWMRKGPEFHRGPRGGTLWALLALGIWSDRHGVEPAG